jgi:hypothetical protein
MRREMGAVFGILFVLFILGCVTTSRYVYEDEIVFDELRYEVRGFRVVDGVEIYQVDLHCRALNNNKTEAYSVEYQPFITYTMTGIGTRTQTGELAWVNLSPDDEDHVKGVVEVAGNPEEFTEMTYGFTYGGLEKGYLNRTIHPKRS